MTKHNHKPKHSHIVSSTHGNWSLSINKDGEMKIRFNDYSNSIILCDVSARDLYNIAKMFLSAAWNKMWDR
jgi:hypothetical protein